MDSIPSRSLSLQGAGALLRERRVVRHLSQLDLALKAGISARHLSYVETGKAPPSRDMIARLADALDLPLRERNALLVAAGYAPKYRESSLAAAELVRSAELARGRGAGSGPPRDQFDARAAGALSRLRPEPLLGCARDQSREDAPPDRLRAGAPLHANVLRQIFDPADVRPLIANWEEVAGNVIGHLHAQIAASPSDAKARALLEEILAYPDIPVASSETSESVRSTASISGFTTALQRC